MEKVILYDWKPGFDKGGLNRLLRDKAGYSLSSAIDAVGKLLERKTIEIEVDSSYSPEEFLNDALNLGAIGQIDTDAVPILETSKKPQTAGRAGKP